MYRTSNSRGFTLVEMAIVMIIVGLLAGVAFPMVSSLLKQGEDKRQQAAVQEARHALLGYVLSHGGFPAPSTFSVNLPRTHLERDADGQPVPTVVGVPGALPSQILGIGSRATGSTLLLYDVHPALRSDLPFEFAPDFADLHAPDNDSQGSAGDITRLCRNLSRIIDIEQQIRLGTLAVPAGGVEDFQYNLPRTWNSTTFDDHWINSTGVAFVVARRVAEYDGRRFDRQNFLSEDGLSEQDYRVYENPSVHQNTTETCIADAANAENADYCYDGQIASVSFAELRQHLQDAGHCKEGIARDRNNEVRVTVQNSVLASLSLAGGGTATGDEQYLCVEQAAPGGGPGGGGGGSGTIQSVTIVSSTDPCSGTRTEIQSGSGSGGGGTTPIPLFMEFHEGSPSATYNCDSSSSENVSLIAPGQSRTHSYPGYQSDGTRNGLSINWFDNDDVECKGIGKAFVDDPNGWLVSDEHMDADTMLPELNLHCLGSDPDTVSCNRI